MPVGSSGNAKNIIIGAAEFWISEDENTVIEYEDVFTSDSSPSARAATKIDADGSFRNVGFTQEGIELSFEPDYGEVEVDQLLEVAKIYKQSMRVSLATSLAEATLENLLIATSGTDEDLSTAIGSATKSRKLDVNAGALGYAPIERTIVAVGPAPDTVAAAGSGSAERIYWGYRAVSMETTTVGVRRNEATVFPVNFRLLTHNSANTGGKDLFGKVVDRVHSA
jgi:hypothetical protein